MSDDGYWAFARVLSDGVGGPDLWTTEPSLVDEVLAELQNLIPSARVAHSDSGYEKLHIRWVRFDRLQGLHTETPHAIVGILCDLGWEPLSEYEFRKRYRSAASEMHKEG
jgi:hypothetical protein